MDNKYALDFEKPLRGLITQLDNLHQMSAEHDIDLAKEIKAIEAKIEDTKKNIYSNLSAWQRVQLSRHPERPYTLDYVNSIFDGFQELHGDRSYRDDRCLIGGTAFLDGQAVMVIGQQKGRNTKENLLRNFGMPNPEGYRKALRLMKMAEKFELPVFTFVDTPGAYPGIGSEERHIAEAIAVNLREMSSLKTPIITAVIGEGGSGGALGIAVANRVVIFDNSYYSVISPEGCAAILWKDRAQASQAAEALKLSAKDLMRFGIVEEIVQEPLGGAHNDKDAAAAALGKSFRKHLKELQSLSTEDLLAQRYDRFRKIGVFEHAVESGNIISIDEAVS